MSISENSSTGCAKGYHQRGGVHSFGEVQTLAGFFASKLGSAPLYSTTAAMAILLHVLTAQLTCHLEKILPWGRMPFMTQCIPFQIPWGHFDGFETKHFGEEHCSPSTQPYRQASEAHQARLELVGGDGNKSSRRLLNRCPLCPAHHCLVTAALCAVVTGQLSLFGGLHPAKHLQG